MIPPAVGTFDLEEIHILNGLRVTKDLMSASTYITAEQVTELLSILLHIEHYLSRPQDVSRIDKSGFYPFGYDDRSIIIDSHKLRDRLLCILSPIKWLNGIKSFFGAFSRYILCIISLNMG